MNIFQWAKNRFKTADKNNGSQSQPQSFSGLQCQVRILVDQNQDRYSWRWHLVSPARVTKNQQAQLDALVARYCDERFGAEYPVGKGAKRQHDDLVAITVLN